MYNRYEQEQDSPRFETQPGQYGQEPMIGHKVGMFSNGLVAFSLGALAGGVVALLLTPENTRRRLKEGAGSLLHSDALKHQGRAVKDAFQTARETYRSEIDRARNEAESEIKSPSMRTPGAPRE